MNAKDRDTQLSDYQMVKHAELLLLDVKKIYPDVKVVIESWIPVLHIEEWVFMWYGALQVLENLREDLYWYS